MKRHLVYWWARIRNDFLRLVLVGPSEQQDGVDTKQLLGHKSASAAALYGDSRGEWVRVSINHG